MLFCPRCRPVYARSDSRLPTSSYPRLLLGFVLNDHEKILLEALLEGGKHFVSDITILIVQIRVQMDDVLHAPPVFLIFY